MEYIAFVAGFIILIFGANFLVDGAASFGKKMKMSSLIIGFTIVAAGTSLPELIINVFASINKQTDLAISNVIGSNTMNTLLVIGVAALIYPIVPTRRTLYVFLPISLFAALLVAFFGWSSFMIEIERATITRVEGVLMLVLMVAFLVYMWRVSNSEGDIEEATISEFSVKKSLFLMIAGIAGLYFGGRWVVNGVEILVERFGISQAVIGITIVAVVTSLPELVTSILAALKKNSGIALGNALGSNIFNVFLVLGVSSVITPLNYSGMLNFDVTVMAMANLAVFLFVILGKGRMINRLEGLLLSLFYFGYIAFLIYRG
jgi:cation:H+ antiporter